MLFLVAGPPFGLLLASSWLLLAAAWLSRKLACSVVSAPPPITSPAKLQDHAAALPGHPAGSPQRHVVSGSQAHSAHSQSIHTHSPHGARKRWLLASASLPAESLWLIASSPYLTALCAFTALTYTTSAMLYFVRALVVSSTMHSTGDRVSYFATLNIITPLLIFGVQLLATGECRPQRWVRVAVC